MVVLATCRLASVTSRLTQKTTPVGRSLPRTGRTAGRFRRALAIGCCLVSLARNRVPCVGSDGGLHHRGHCQNAGYPPGLFNALYN
jgi:hypothetical protein